MKTEIIYIREETGANHDGKACIEERFFTRKLDEQFILMEMFFFCFTRKGKRTGNCFDIETGDRFPVVSGCERMEDRHKFGKVQ
jgi:hypothetical protein